LVKIVSFLYRREKISNRIVTNRQYLTAFLANEMVVQAIG